MSTGVCTKLDEHTSGVQLTHDDEPLAWGRSWGDGRYELRQVLGEGATSRVYRAQQIALDREVAIKVYFPRHSQSEQGRHSIDQEARQLAACDHGHVVRILDRGTDGDRSFLALELLAGESLGDRLRVRGTLSEAEIVAHMQDVLGGLGHLHARGIAHRDVKLQNIMVVPSRDDDGLPIERAKICDLGLAAPFDPEDIQRSDVVQGTPEYMAPEQVMGKAVDGRADIYAVGVCMYQMLVGAPPFQGEEPLKTARMQVRRPMPRPSEKNPLVTPELEAVVMQATMKEPGQRFGSAAEMSAALRALSPSASVHDVADAPNTRARKRSSQHRAAHGQARFAKRIARGRRTRLGALAGAAFGCAVALTVEPPHISSLVPALRQCSHLASSSLRDVPHGLATCLSDMASNAVASSESSEPTAAVLAAQ